MNLAKKISAWIQNLINDITSFFNNGEKLIKKYGEEIKKAYKEKGNKITVKTAIYKLNLEKFTRGFYDIVNKVLGDEATFDKNNKPLEEVKKEAIECIRVKEEKEYKVSEIDISDIIEIVGSKQKIIKALKKMNRQIQTAFKAAAVAIKLDQKANNPQFSKEQSSAVVKSINYSCKCISVSINTYIKEIKTASRTYTAICRKLLKSVDNKDN